MQLGLVAILALATFVSFVSSEQDSKINDVKKRSADEPDTQDVGLLDDDDVMDKRGRLFRYGRGGIFRYGKRAPVFRYGKRAPVFRYGKRSDDMDDGNDDEIEGMKRLFRWGKRSDDTQQDMKRLFRWGKRSDDDAEEDDVEDLDGGPDKRKVFRYGKRSQDEAKRRVFRFGKRADYLDSFKYGRDTRVPDQPHVPFRFGEDE